MVVAKVIEFYIPKNFRRRVKWVPLEQRGKVIKFGARNSSAAPVGTIAREGDSRNQPVLEKAIIS
jgi:hypothetical protein